MRLTQTFMGVLTCGFLSLTPAFAGQHGHNPTPTPATTHSTASTNTASTGTHPAPVPVPQKIAANPALVARLQPLLPSHTTLASAATGFKNQGQFIAALHVSHNLNIPFAKLKAQVNQLRTIGVCEEPAGPR